mmetsp:Transcript_26734/g.55819  ORF Transcript_26734/g.55819 Transcript_26734/m.55819 type:complete len:272 (+) Transcript_26734:538-1353(+)
MVCWDVSSCFVLKETSSFISSRRSALGISSVLPIPLLMCSSSATMVCFVASWSLIVSSFSMSKLCRKVVISWSLWKSNSYLCVSFLATLPLSLSSRSLCRSAICLLHLRISSSMSLHLLSSSVVFLLSSFTFSSNLACASLGSIWAMSMSSSSMVMSFLSLMALLSSPLNSSLMPLPLTMASSSWILCLIWSSSCSLACPSWCNFWLLPMSSSYSRSLAGSSFLILASACLWTSPIWCSRSWVPFSFCCLSRNTLSISAASFLFLASRFAW